MTLSYQSDVSKFSPPSSTSSLSGRRPQVSSTEASCPLQRTWSVSGEANSPASIPSTRDRSAARTQPRGAPSRASQTFTKCGAAPSIPRSCTAPAPSTGETTDSPSESRPRSRPPRPRGGQWNPPVGPAPRRRAHWRPWRSEGTGARPWEPPAWGPPGAWVAAADG